MEPKKEPTSSSSITTDLFGAKEPSSSPLFDSISPPLPKIHTGDYISSEETKKNNDSTTKGDSLDNEDKSQDLKTFMSKYYDQEAPPPCNLCSSIYYGGQDIIINPRITKNNTPGYSTKYNKDGEDDGLAWWQGGLYY